MKYLCKCITEYILIAKYSEHTKMQILIKKLINEALTMYIQLAK